MLQTLYARAKESKKTDHVIYDAKAIEIVEELDYDFTKADKDTAMASGVIARTIVLDQMVGEFLEKKSGRSRCKHCLRSGHPLLSDGGQI